MRGPLSPSESTMATLSLRRVVRQAEDGEIDAGADIGLGGRVLALFGAIETSSTSARPASFSRICRPVVPASPSMKIFLCASVMLDPRGGEAVSAKG